MSLKTSVGAHPQYLHAIMSDQITVFAKYKTQHIYLFTLSFYSRAHCAPLGTAHLSFSARHVRPLVSEANESIQKPPRVLLIMVRLRTKKGLQGGKTIQQRSEFFASLVPNASTVLWPMPLCALCTHMCVYLLLWFYSAKRGCHTSSFSGAGTHDSDGPLGLNVVT